MQAVGLTDDDGGVFPLIACGKLGVEKLRRTADASERIFHFVREVSQKGLGGLVHPRLLFLTHQLHGVVHGGDFQHPIALASR